MRSSGQLFTGSFGGAWPGAWTGDHEHVGGSKAFGGREVPKESIRREKGSRLKTKGIERGEQVQLEEETEEAHPENLRRE